VRKILRISLGVFLVIIGLIGWILPVIPGWPALIPGLMILGEYFPPIHRLNEKIKAKVFKNKAQPDARG
jgi:uncharacterized membrane protein YbaN (DUF454 family)